MEKLTNTVNINSQLCHSRHLLVHLHIPKHLQLLNYQQRMSLLQQTNIKKSVFYSQNPIQNDATCTNNDDIQSCETPKSQNYSISTISTPNHHPQHITSTSSSTLNFNTPTILPQVGKEYMCFMKEGKSDQAAREVVDSVLSIDTFEQKCVVLKFFVAITATKISRTDHWY